MTGRGLEMIDAIQGPPRWDGPDVLLRQTSFRALAEPRNMRLPDGRVVTGALRVRFGEVEARGIALTPAGRARYDELLEETDRRAVNAGAGAAEVAPSVWEEEFPDSERALIDAGLAYFTYRLADGQARTQSPPAALPDLLDQGWVRADPIVYEDFLPRSAAGIFQSNLSGDGTRNTSREGARYDLGWLAGAIGRDIRDPFALYEQEQRASLDAVARDLQLDGLLG
jgi:uncharacterized glyoxalase superfamily metalloenzyme YdcJ